MAEENPNLRIREGTLSPLQRMLLHPEKFDPDKLSVNEIEQPDGLIIAKIPKLENRIYRRKKANGNEYYVELVLSQQYDPESRQNRNKKVIIGTDISYHLKGMMIANDNYHEYFNYHGDLLPHIKQMMQEENQRKQQAKAATDKQSDPLAPAGIASQEQQQHQPAEQSTNPEFQKQTQQTNEPTAQSPKQKEPAEEEGEADEVQIRELRTREEELNKREEKLNRLQKELENQQMLRIIQLDNATEDHIHLLRDILHNHLSMVEEQAKRRPGKPMSIRQIRIINEILQELQILFTGSEAEDFLHLADEPNETDTENSSGTTYGEMALLLNAYSSILYHYTCGRLRTKN